MNSYSLFIPFTYRKCYVIHRNNLLEYGFDSNGNLWQKQSVDDMVYYSKFLIPQGTFKYFDYLGLKFVNSDYLKYVQI